MRDIGERTRVHERRHVLDRLHQIGLDRVLEQHSHRTGGSETLRERRQVLMSESDDDPAETFAQVGW